MLKKRGALICRSPSENKSHLTHYKYCLSFGRLSNSPKNYKKRRTRIGLPLVCPVVVQPVVAFCYGFGLHSQQLCFQLTVLILNIGTDRSEQTVQTQIRLLLMEQSDQGLLCLLFCLHLLSTILHCKIQLFQW